MEIYDRVLDSISIAVSIAYWVTMIGSLLFAGAPGRNVTFSRLIRATKWAWAAVAAAAVNVVVNALNVPTDGIVWPLLWGTVLVFGVFTASQTRKRRDIKGDQVTADAERTVREHIQRPAQER